VLDLFKFTQYRASLVASLALFFALPTTSYAQLFRPFSDSKINQEQWDVYFSEVSKKHSVGARDLESERLQMFFNAQTQVVYTFTKPGHPAHPAWISRLIVSVDKKLALSLVGFYAGSDTEYQKLFDQTMRTSQQLRDALAASAAQ
jgi:hypothetical protein